MGVVIVGVWVLVGIEIGFEVGGINGGRYRVWSGVEVGIKLWF